MVRAPTVRAHVTQEVRTAYDDAASGNGRVVMLVGEPGIGKTRLAEELEASTSGKSRVLWGRCPEQQVAPPYWPWAQLIRAYVADSDADQLRSILGRHGPTLAELVPEVREAVPDLADPPETTDPDEARFKLFDAVSSFLSRAAGSEPLLLILDDLHCADTASLKLLEFVAVGVPDVPLMILGTYRDLELSRRHPLAETLGSIGTRSAFRRIPVRGLTGSGVEELIAAVAGTGWPAPVSQRNSSPAAPGPVSRLSCSATSHTATTTGFSFPPSSPERKNRMKSLSTGLTGTPRTTSASTREPPSRVWIEIPGRSTGPEGRSSDTTAWCSRPAVTPLCRRYPGRLAATGSLKAVCSSSERWTTANGLRTGPPTPERPS